MHPFFEVLRATLVTRPGEQGRILFRVLGIEEERISIDLKERVAVEASSDITADLTIFCDRAQLDAMLESGFTSRALRYVGDASLLEHLASLMTPAKSPISIRGDER